MGIFFVHKKADQQLIYWLFLISISIIFLLFSGVIFAEAADPASCDSVTDNETQDMLQARLRQCQADIQQQTDLLHVKAMESTNLERDLSILGYKINQNTFEIKARDLTIATLDNSIDQKGQVIDDLLTKIDSLKSTTAELIKKTNEVEAASLVEVILTSQNISEFYQDLGTFDSLEYSIGNTVSSIKQAKSTAEQNKKDLQDKQDKEKALKALQVIDQRKQQVIQDEKNRILKESKGQEKIYKDVLAKKIALVNEIKNRILKITGGGELAFGDALKLVRVAENAIGIRAAFVLSILTQESGMNGVIGKNLGKCFYNTPWNNLSATVMSDSQKPSFMYIMQNIGKDPNTTPVSCPISKDGQYGGAMGPSQFMPKTWWDVGAQTGYKSRVESVTKSSFASPFDNLDAFTATALYLNDALDGCKQIYKTQTSQESCAAAKYYAGANWRRYTGSYGASVAARANSMQKDIDTLDSQ